MTNMKKQKDTFEESLKRLQEISDLLESGTVGLEDSVTLYEEGIVLSKKCFKQLQDAELKITELKKQLEQ
ncbi:MAG: exodeoxyribonuclease VII small subunit [Ignavibacteria bacterium]|nr:exodeoxyribonuclease VII small subunit [Ignavibacteria bacterium]